MAPAAASFPPPRMGALRAEPLASPSAGPGMPGRAGRVLFVLLLAVAAALWVYIAVRARTLAFTADESLSFSIIHPPTSVASTANNQWLNTWLMRVAQALLGDRPWELRLPNVLSFGIYAGSCLLVISRMRSAVARILCFLGCFADPFLIEFFGLARGYGLSLAFAAAAFALVMVGRTGPPERLIWRIAGCASLGALSFYANFSALNLVLALLALMIVDAWIAHRNGAARIGRRQIVLIAAVLLAFVAVMIPGLAQLRQLQATGQLYYGGSRGFVQDTVGTLVQTWGYVYHYVDSSTIPLLGWARTGAWLVVASAFVLVMFAAGRCWRARRWATLQVAALLLVLLVVLELAERTIGGALYPIDRAALPYVPVFAVLLGLSADAAVDLTRRATGRAVMSTAVGAVAVLAVANFLSASNTSSALTWRFDASALNLVRRLEAIHARLKPNAQRLSIVVPVPRDYALLNYYSRVYRLSWLNIIVHQGTTPVTALYDVPAGSHRPVVSHTRLIAVLAPDGTELRAGPAYP